MSPAPGRAPDCDPLNHDNNQHATNENLRIQNLWDGIEVYGSRLARTIRQVFPDALVAPYLGVGTTDSRHYAPLTRNIFRFRPLRLGRSDLRRIHGADERVSVADYARAVRFYVQLLRNAGQ